MDEIVVLPESKVGSLFKGPHINLCSDAFPTDGALFSLGSFETLDVV
jgi:hypothetical protein